MALANALFVAARLLTAPEDAPLAVAYNAAGSRLYAEMGMQLYRDDQDAVERCNDAARDQLGESAFVRAVELGESWSRTHAADRVTETLETLAEALG